MHFVAGREECGDRFWLKAYIFLKQDLIVANLSLLLSCLVSVDKNQQPVHGLGTASELAGACRMVVQLPQPGIAVGNTTTGTEVQEPVLLTSLLNGSHTHQMCALNRPLVTEQDKQDFLFSCSSQSHLPFPVHLFGLPHAHLSSVDTNCQQITLSRRLKFQKINNEKFPLSDFLI